jgi:thiol-disulfide isomerase/thioredoxin
MPTNLYNIITSQKGWLNTSRALTPDDLKDRIILLDFWTYCCINCMHVIPDLKYLEEKFGDKLTVIGVHSAKFKNEQDSENIRSAILRYDIHHPVVNDFDFSIWQKFGIRAWPTFVLIGPKGVIDATYSGEGNRDKAARDITALIEKYQGKLNTSALPLALEKDKAPPSLLSFPGKIGGHWTVYSGFDNDPIAIADSGHNRILLVHHKTYETQGQIGSGKRGFKDGSFDAAEFDNPQGLAIEPQFVGKLYIADTGNHAIRMADWVTRTVTTIAGTGKQGYEREVQNKPALSVPLASPWDVEFYPDEKHLVIAMAGTHQLWSYDIEKKTVSVIAGNGRESIDDGKYPYNSLSQPSGLSAYGGKLYFVDSETSSLRVYENGAVKTLIGSGLFDFGYKEGKKGEALMQHAIGVYADASGVYVADSYNHSIRRFDPATGVLSNYAGHGVRGKKDGALLESEFNEPNDIVKIDDKLYVADTNNNAIRVIENGKVSTLAISEVKKQSAEYSSQLPNLESLPSQDVQSGATVLIGLQKDWHINDEAPSTLALFDADKKFVAGFTFEQIKTRTLTLPALKPGSYYLNGTLYYCEDQKGAQCFIKSFDAPLTVTAKGKKEIALKLN